MKRLIALLKVWAKKIRKYVSPLFLALFALSVVLWYITKLSYTYSTDLEVNVNIDGQNIVVPCVVEAKGTTLLYYKLHGRQELYIPRSDLKYETLPNENANQNEEDSTATKYARISPAAMQHALSVKLNDLKILAVGKIPDIKLTEE